MPTDPQELIALLQLKPHPEGGHYAETFRADLSVASTAHAGPRAASTAIYFLLKQGEFSAFHSVRSDEVWHYYLGDPLELFLVDQEGVLTRFVLGNDFARGERPQAVAPRDVLQAARPHASGTHGFTLCGCTVAPGFDFTDFEMPAAAVLAARHPQHTALFQVLSRPRRDATPG
jgi:predicted cupin superfamily sugar epimerase